MAIPFVRPRRSLLGVPALNESARAAAVHSAADVLMLDLESSIEPTHKDEARAQVAPFLADDRAHGPDGTREVVVRVNAIDSKWCADDVAAACAADADAIVLPEVRSADDLARLENLMATASAATDVAMWSMVETAEAVLDAGSLCRASARLAVVVVGTNDLASALHLENAPNREPLATALSWTVVAARAAGRAVIDGSFSDPDDHDGLVTEARQGRALGFDGKTLIHTLQIEPANTIFG